RHRDRRLSLQPRRRSGAALRAGLRAAGRGGVDPAVRRHPDHPLHRPRHRGRQLVRGLAAHTRGGQGGPFRARRVSRILVLTALDVEARGLARHLGLDPIPSTSSPRYAGGALEIATVGLGARALAERQSAWPSPTVVVSAGACGAMAPELQVGDLVTPEIVLGPDGRRHATAALTGLSRRGTLLTTEHVLEDGAAKSRLWLGTGHNAGGMGAARV